MTSSVHEQRSNVIEPILSQFTKLFIHFRRNSSPINDFYPILFVFYHSKCRIVSRFEPFELWFRSEIDGTDRPSQWVNKYSKTTGTRGTNRYPVKISYLPGPGVPVFFKHDFPIGKACRERSRRSLVPRFETKFTLGSLGINC